jgi:hypothetical protein
MSSTPVGWGLNILDTRTDLSCDHALRKAPDGPCPAHSPERQSLKMLPRSSPSPNANACCRHGASVTILVWSIMKPSLSTRQLPLALPRSTGLFSLSSHCDGIATVFASLFSLCPAKGA